MKNFEKLAILFVIGTIFTVSVIIVIQSLRVVR